LRQLFEYAIEHNKFDGINPAKQVTLLKGSQEGIRAWSEADVKRFVARHPPGTTPYLALALMLYLTVRRSDVFRLGPQHVQEDRILFREHNNRFRKPKDHDLPLHPELAAVIAGTPHAKDAFVVTVNGMPFANEDSFGNAMCRWCRDAGLKGLSSHGLRKLAASSLAESGASAHEIAALTGHSTLKEVARYTRKVDKRKLADAVIQKQIVPLAKTSNNVGTILYPRACCFHTEAYPEFLR